jgi:hypothetical protein
LVFGVLGYITLTRSKIGRKSTAADSYFHTSKFFSF